MDNAIQVRNIFVPWDYGLISTVIPDDGELVCVKNAPNFTGQNRTVIGDGAHNIAWLIAQLVITPSDLQQEILAEQAARIAADNAHAALTSAHSASATPANNRSAMYGASGGLKSAKTPSESNDVIRKTEMYAEAQARDAADTALQGNISAEASLRHDADQAEAQARDAADTALQDQIDGINTELGEIPGIYAPIHSPHFTGVPTPEPDYTVPEQVADVGAVLHLRDVLILTLLRDVRITRGDYALMPRMRVTRRRDRIRGVYPA